MVPIHSNIQIHYTSVCVCVCVFFHTCRLWKWDGEKEIYSHCENLSPQWFTIGVQSNYLLHILNFTAPLTTPERPGSQGLWLEVKEWQSKGAEKEKVKVEVKSENFKMMEMMERWWSREMESERRRERGEKWGKKVRNNEDEGNVEKEMKVGIIMTATEVGVIFLLLSKTQRNTQSGEAAAEIDWLLFLFALEATFSDLALV